LGIAGLGDITLGADLDGACGEHGIVVHAEHDDARRCIAPEDAPRQFVPRHGRQVDVENADIRMLCSEGAFAALGVGCFQEVDIRVVREQRAAPRSNDAMIINDQNAHWHWSRIPASIPCCTASDQIDGADVGATLAVDGYATGAIMLYAPIR
jgi:hypothetical protein